MTQVTFGTTGVEERSPWLDVADAAGSTPFVELAGGGEAVLPAYVVEPGTATGPHARVLAAAEAAVCCAPGECGPDGMTAAAGAPVLLLGAPGWTGGWVTEVSGAPDGDVIDALVGQAVAHAFGAGARIVAPGCTSRAGGERLEQALVAAGATAQQLGYDDYVAIDAALPPAVPRRHDRDLAAAADAGIVIRRLDATEVEAYRPRFAELSAAVEGTDAGGDQGGDAVLWWGAFAGADLRGYCAALPFGDALWLGSRGFAPDLHGFNVGAYFALTHHAVVDAAAALGYRRVEFGGGAHYARIVRGCSSRPVRACTLDPEVP